MARLGDVPQENMMNAGQASPLWRLVAKRNRNILSLNDGGAACPLYFVHSISGELTSLLELVRLLGTDRKIYGIQVPPERLHGDFTQSVHSIAAHYVDLLNTFQPDGPLMLGGWSAGAVICLEMAQLFRQSGREVVLIAALDGLLYNTSADLTWHSSRFYTTFLVNLCRRIAIVLKTEWDVRSVGSRIVREYRRFGASLRWLRPKSVPGQGLDVYLDSSGWPAEQAAFARGLFDAAMCYTPTPYGGRVVLYAAKVRPIFTLSPVVEAWRTIATDIEAIEVDGTHTNILHLPQVKTVAEDLRARLAASTTPAAIPH